MFFFGMPVPIFCKHGELELICNLFIVLVPIIFFHLPYIKLRAGNEKKLVTFLIIAKLIKCLKIWRLSDLIVGYSTIL